MKGSEKMQIEIKGSAKEIAKFLINLKNPTKSNEFIPCDSNGYHYSQGGTTNPKSK